MIKNTLDPVYRTHMVEIDMGDKSETLQLRATYTLSYSEIEDYVLTELKLLGNITSYYVDGLNQLSITDRDYSEIKDVMNQSYSDYEYIIETFDRLDIAKVVKGLGYDEAFRELREINTVHKQREAEVQDY